VGVRHPRRLPADESPLRARLNRSDVEQRLEEWGTVLGDEVMAAALIDRVLHHCHLTNIRGNSFRMREHTALRQALTEDLDVEVSRSGRSRAKGGN
jgi:hypothetical protein